MQRQPLDPFIESELSHDLEDKLWREMVPPRSGLTNLSSNDYLGLSGHPQVLEAAEQALRTHGAGARAARTLGGTTGLHLDLESALAVFKDSESALLFPTGYMAALGTLGTLMGPGDVCILDRSCHACLFDGVRYSGARIRVFEHNNPDHLETLITHEKRTREPRFLFVVVEGLYSMDGDLAPLEPIASRVRAHQGHLIVDEAHSNGIYGDQGKGRCAQTGVTDETTVILGTLGKSFGSAGGFVTGPASRIDFIRQRARSFLFTTAAPPATVGAALAALKLISGQEGDRRRHLLVQQQRQAGILLPPSARVESPIITLPVPDDEKVVALANELEKKGVLAAAVRPPTVPRGQTRLRLSLTAAHTMDEMTEAFQTISQHVQEHVGLVEA